MGAEPLGAAWWGYFRADAPRYGFVDEATPEISAAVLPAHRKPGIVKPTAYSDFWGLTAAPREEQRCGAPRSAGSTSPARVAKIRSGWKRASAGAARAR
jgi:hypothetical protein